MTYDRLQNNTSVARNFEWEGPKIEKFCDAILVTSFDWRNGDDVTKMTSWLIFWSSISSQSA